MSPPHLGHWTTLLSLSVPQATQDHGLGLSSANALVTNDSPIKRLITADFMGLILYTGGNLLPPVYALLVAPRATRPCHSDAVLHNKAVGGSDPLDGVVQPPIGLHHYLILSYVSMCMLWSLDWLNGSRLCAKHSHSKQDKAIHLIFLRCCDVFEG
jgi:hypothetical protein